MHSERKIIYMRGLPASGKSTMAKETLDHYGDKAARINFDSLRESFHFGEHSNSREKLVKQAARAAAKALFDGGVNVIVMDNTGFSKSQASFRDLLANDNNAEVKIVDFTWVPVDECISRDRRRGKDSVGEDVIRKFWNDYVREPAGAAGHDLSLGQCVIVDLDGTIFDHGDERSPYDGDKVYNDEVRNHVATVVRLLYNDGYRIVFMSGREDIGKCRSETLRCINDKLPDIGSYEFYMRKAGDHRKDCLIKKELYENNVRGKYDVFAIIDDRSQIVMAWDELGFGDRIFRVGRIHGDNF